jgi:colicin import membrane protein
MTGETPRGAPPDPGKWVSIGLAVTVHAVLALLLFFGLRWQNRVPEAVEVELYRPAPAPQSAPAQPAPKPEPPAPQPKPEPRPEPEAKPPPKPEPRPEAKPPPKPEPRPEARPPPKPDIAVKDKPRPEPKPLPKDEPAHPGRAETQRLKDLIDELQRETERVAQRRAQQEAEAEAAQLRERQAAQASARAQSVWTDRIKQKIRPNIVVPPGAGGNPEAVFDVSLLPDGAVLSVRLKKSSGNPALDAAIERAINKSSPLPKPEDPAAFTRELTLRFRPLQE